MTASRLVVTIALCFSAAFWLLPAAPRPEHGPLRPQPYLHDVKIKPVSRDRYVGDETCGLCHLDKFESFSKTAHHLTSRQATADSISGKFASGSNILKTSNPGLSFRMDARGGRFYETAIFGIPPSTTKQTESIDIVIGSGRKGQTYLFWKGEQLFQLPVSYWIDLGHWVNSPGYTDGDASFDRPVMPRCLECHGSYAESLAGPQENNRYSKSSVVLGISCERCHGPGREHVDHHQSAISGNSPEAIINPAKLPRDRNIEVCAQCHAGKRFPIAPAFSYLPGQPLDDYLDRDVSDPNSTIDVHGGQVALLQKSRCYQSSGTMTCSTCHNVHESQRNAAAFSSRCLTCHKVEDCRMLRKTASRITDGCVDCHMPVQQSKAIATDSNGRQTKAQVRNHWIKVCPGTGISQLEEPDFARRVKLQ